MSFDNKSLPGYEEGHSDGYLEGYEKGVKDGWKDAMSYLKGKILIGKEIPDERPS